ncbi:MAG: hypothetical protein Q7U82_01550 [Gammaproteobacteria bacterium]|nr:hypothetical protein [Gammaproteobacteria bacterium]
MIRYIIWISLLFSSIVVAKEDALEISERDLPLTIEVTQDVQVKSSESRGQPRGTLYTAGNFRISKGQRFQMVAIGQEGGCRIIFQDAEHDLSSCPWLPGFRDHQQDIFVVIPGEKVDEK